MGLLLLKVSLLLGVTLAGARMLRRVPAATRYGLWSLVFGAMLLLPALATVLPAIRIPLPPSWSTPSGSSIGSASAGSGSGVFSPASGVTQIPDSTESVAVTPPSARRSTLPSLSTLLFAGWIAGLIVAGTAVLLSHYRVRRLVRQAVAVQSQGWYEAAASLAAQLGLRGPVRLLLSDSVGTPMAGGVLSPFILLPKPATEWSDDQRDLVLAHELSHLAQFDPLRHLVTRLAVACYWFHPLVWFAAREAAFAREQACDETVLATGAKPSEYARVLLDLAESLSAQPGTRLTGALPMVHRSQLEKRLMAILNVNHRRSARRLLLGPAIGITVLTLSVAAATPFVARPFAETYARPFAETYARPLAESIARAPEDSSEPLMVMQAGRDRDSACPSERDGRSFIGNMSTRLSGGRTVITEQVGWRDNDRVIQQTLGDLRLCMIAEGAGDRRDNERPSQWTSQARRVLMEAQVGSNVQRLEISGGNQTWQVNGATREFNAAAQTWRDRMLAVLDTTWEVSTLRGEVSSLQGQISSIQGQRSSLQGQISSLRGQVSSMQGQISSALGHESSLRGQISSIQGHLSALQAKIAAERREISRLRMSPTRVFTPVDPRQMAVDLSIDQRERNRIATEIADHEAAIARIERQIRDYAGEGRIAALQKEIDTFNATAKAKAIEAEIRNFNLESKVAAVERRIADLDVEGQVARIQRQIDSLDADRRVRQLEDRRDRELAQLNTAIAAIR